ncbi:hypothetical protein SAMN05443529_103174 [Desulfosporosinus hippei DSM 8344]|uniref:Uncharacterized protein n=1 Tax=Desulfosporosinus hippei DSM 8344 TaxID=1121419 RepID=A0A1G7UKS4_9FIRM|nr:hypothetical protein SAMN05443529_103174 [Desulfosporosinus hippei DSM 8344]
MCFITSYANYINTLIEEITASSVSVGLNTFVYLAFC